MNEEQIVRTIPIESAQLFKDTLRFDKEIVTEIIFEMLEQFNKWGNQNHSFAIWSTILNEEIGETSRAYLEDVFFEKDVDLKTYVNVRKELIQVTTVAVRMILNIDRNNTQDIKKEK